jgi:hypothetical protein
VYMVAKFETYGSHGSRVQTRSASAMLCFCVVSCGARLWTRQRRRVSRARTVQPEPSRAVGYGDVWWWLAGMPGVG